MNAVYTPALEDVLPPVSKPAKPNLDATKWDVHEHDAARDYQRAIDRGDTNRALRSLEVLRRQARFTRHPEFRQWVQSL